MLIIITHFVDGKCLSGVAKAQQSDPTTIEMKIDLKSESKGDIELKVEMLVFYCSDKDKTCKRQCVLITQPVQLNV